MAQAIIPLELDCFEKLAAKGGKLGDLHEKIHAPNRSIEVSDDRIMS